MKTIVFDLDGTLADTSVDLIEAANACFRGRGLGDLLDPERDKLTAFHGGRAMLKLGFSRVSEAEDEALIDAEYPNLLRHYDAHIDDQTILYPGAVEAINRLRSDEYVTSICTNKPEGLARKLIDRLGVSPLFDALIGADTLPVRKPDPEPYHQAVLRAGGTIEESLLIGDTITDVNTAKAANVPCILVEFGPEGREIARLQPDALLPHFDQLDGVVRDLIG